MSSEIEQFLQRVAQRQLEKAQRAAQAEAEVAGEDTYQPSAPIQRGQVAQRAAGERAAGQRAAAGERGDVQRAPVQRGGGKPAAQPPSTVPRTRSRRDEARRPRDQPKEAAKAKPIRDPHIEATYPVNQPAGGERPAAVKRQPAGEADSAVQSLIEILRQPQGVQQAVLLKEILDRPLHRW